MHSIGRLGRSLFVGLSLLVGCGGQEAPVPTADGAEATGTVESAVYESPDSLAGLLGSYSRTWPPAAPEELLTMTLTGVEQSDRVEGSYVRTVSRMCPFAGCNTEWGSFVALPNNPAVGPIILFTDPAGAERDYYAIVKIQRSIYTGKITDIVLVKGGSAMAQQFTMTRTSY